MQIGILIGVIAVLISFVLVVFGFLNIFPLYIATPLLFVSIFFIIVRINNKNRFKGFKI
ncbi:hypothetical protein [Pseudalkalibacillus salsuginis]|uniref:hypothetical protein n=1 Tax=Pseudalkalibacillus salsuginis TaxID=2910972 RepID=UPI001F2F27DB|nr:hypothetical protein [Pseudalkalibacillus salsuginis]MCF6409187.1 hypothetical protein [Pseudalkalibacillus salsuginis]